MNRIINFLTSDRGKKFIFFTISTTCIGSCSFLYIPNTVLISQYQKLFEMYRDGEPVLVEGETLEKFKEVIIDINSFVKPRGKITPFIAYGFDTVSAGHTNTLQGAIIGIPSTFEYKTIEDVDKNPIRVNGKFLDPELDVANRLKESIILSDNAKKYAICREILLTNTNVMYFQASYPPIIIITLNFFSQFCKKVFGVERLPPINRGIVYSLLTILGYSVWILLKDNTNLYFESMVEHQICSLGESYIHGGLEYYSKCLEKNKALRELMYKGDSKYTVTGNENYKFRNKSIPLTARQEFFKTQLSNINVNVIC
uniref:Transmembrane protein 177 n=1 Tax=Clastoptera arizonana TaxID=38151 RepID=A0A1B6E208_9HEMI